MAYGPRLIGGGGWRRASSAGLRSPHREVPRRSVRYAGSSHAPLLVSVRLTWPALAASLQQRRICAAVAMQVRLCCRETSLYSEPLRPTPFTAFAAPRRQRPQPSSTFAELAPALGSPCRLYPRQLPYQKRVPSAAPIRDCVAHLNSAGCPCFGRGPRRGAAPAWPWPAVAPQRAGRAGGSAWQGRIPRPDRTGRDTVGQKTIVGGQNSGHVLISLSRESARIEHVTSSMD